MSSASWANGWLTGDVVTAAEFKKGFGCIYDTTLGTSAASIDVTGIVSGYAHLLIEVYARDDNAGAGMDNLLIRFNGDTGSNYDYQRVTGANTTVSADAAAAGTSGVIGIIVAGGSTANRFGHSNILIPNYANAANDKIASSFGGGVSGTAASSFQAFNAMVNWRSTAAINRVTLLSSTGNLVTGTRVSIYAQGS